MITYRNCDRRFEFLWEAEKQPAARWNRKDDGPVQYLADTPYGAWAEFIRHEEITDEADLVGVSRALWAVDVDVSGTAMPKIPIPVALGDAGSYPACQAEAERIRETGATGIRARSAALKKGGATGFRVEDGYDEGPQRDGFAYVLFGRRPDAVGWPVVLDGRPPAAVLERTRHF